MSAAGGRRLAWGGDHAGKRRSSESRPAAPTRRAAQRMTAMTGAVLLVLFVAECRTLVNIGNLLTMHVFRAMLLLRRRSA